MMDALQKTRRLIETVHPDPFFYHPPDVFNSEYEYFVSNIESGIDAETFFVLFEKYIALLHDYHTRLWAIMPDEKGPYYLPYRMFPIHINKFAEGYFLVDGAFDERSKVKRIIGLNGLPVEQVIQRMKEYVPAETESHFDLLVCRYLKVPAFLRQVLPDYEFGTLDINLEDGGTVSFNADDLCYVMYDNTWDNDARNAYYVDPKRGLVFREKDEERNFPDTFSNMQFSMIDQNIAYYRLSLCNDIGLKASYDAFFKEVKENDCGNIIFDIRHNPGGNPNTGSQLIEYLHASSDDVVFQTIVKNDIDGRDLPFYPELFRFFFKLRYKKGTLPECYDRLYLDNCTVYDIPLINLTKHYGIVEPQSRFKEIKKSEKSDARFFLLTDGLSGSASVQLVLLFKALYPNHVIIGTPPAEGPFMTNISFEPEIVPGMYIWFPSQKSVLDPGSIGGLHFDRIDPDIFLEQSAVDYQNGKDTLIDYIAVNRDLLQK